MSPTQYLPPGMLVDVNGYRLHLYRTGDGSPTVLLETGSMGWSTDWRFIQPEIENFTRVCSYDRAGLGWSDAGPSPRHTLQMVEELSTLLLRGEIDGPYVLVGAYFGGHVMRLFAHLYPDDVAGMVLIDARHQDFATRMPPAWSKQAQGMMSRHRILYGLSRLGILNLAGKVIGDKLTRDSIRDLPPHIKAMFFDATFLATNIEELQAGDESDKQLAACGDLGDLPLIVMRHGIPDLFTRLPVDQAEQAEQTWIELQSELTQLSTKSKLVVAENSGKNIPLQQPELVVETIRQVVETVRWNIRLNE